MLKWLTKEGWKQYVDRIKSLFGKDKKGKSSSDQKNDKDKEDEDIEKRMREQIEKLSANNGRKDGRTWADALSDNQPANEATNDKISEEHSRGLGDPSSGTTEIKEKKSLQELMEESLTKTQKREERLKAEKEKDYQEKDQKRQDELSEKKQEGKLKKEKEFGEKEQIRRGNFEEANDPNNQEFTALEEQEQSLQTRQMDLLKSDSTSYFLPQSSLSAAAVTIDDNKEGALDLLKKEDYTTPQEIIDEWKERRGSPINGEEYYRIHEEIEPSAPPMSLDADLDGGEDGASDGGTDGGSDGGGDGGGD